jgi:hypothetical protein
VTPVAAIAEIYCQQVVPFKTRRIALPGRKCAAQIMYTFLGYEVKAGRRRLTCPDLVTARYLKLFAELGMKQVLIPYDPTRTGRFIERLEGSFAILTQSAQGEALRKTFAQLRRTLIACQTRSSS